MHTQEYRDAAGQVINYGARWGDDSPPVDSYSVTSNLERFLPLHAVADALIAYLADNFDVTVSDDLGHADSLLHPRTDVIRAVRLTPGNPGGAPITFVFTSFPSVIVDAGAATELLFPVCGCDACDESWDGLCDQLEWQVLAVAAGNLHERMIADGWGAAGDEGAFQFTITSVDGSSSRGSGSIMTGLATPERLAAAAEMLAAHPDGWDEWRARA